MDDDNKIFYVPPTKGFEIQYYIHINEDAVERKTIFPVHVHDCLEIYYLFEGTASFMVDNTIYPMKAGDAIFCRPNEVHHCIRERATLHSNACFWFMTESDFLIGPFLHEKYRAGRILSPENEEKRAEIRNVILKLKSLKERGSLDEYSLLIDLVKLWRSCLSKGSETGKLPEQLQLILNDISENITEIRNLSYLTEKYYLSSSQMRRMFETHLGTTPKSYLEGRRLAYSRVLLRNGARVTDACIQSGFSDLSNYIRLFKSTFDITPSEYRRGGSIPDPNKLKKGSASDPEEGPVKDQSKKETEDEQ